MHTVAVQQQITTIELMKEQSKKQKKTKKNMYERVKLIRVQNSFLEKFDSDIY